MVLIGLSLFGACKSAETTPVSLPENEVLLGLGKSARIGTDLIVRVDTLQDSRCPANVECFWEGYAFVSATVSNAISQQRVRLYLNSQSRVNRKDSAGVMLSGQTYKVILRDVYQVNQEQQAVIQVTKL